MAFLCVLVQVYLIICVIRVVTTWLDLAAQGGILAAASTISYTLTEPLFATIRRAIPNLGDIPIDVSPIIVFVLLGLLRGLICSI